MDFETTLWKALIELTPVHTDIVHALVNVKAAIVDFVDVFALELHAPAVLNEVRNNKITRVVRALLAECHKEEEYPVDIMHTQSNAITVNRRTDLLRKTSRIR